MRSPTKMGAPQRPETITMVREPLPAELYFFESYDSARRQGFGATARHREHPNFRGWWPGCDVDSLRGLRFSRVYVSEHLHRRMADGATAIERQDVRRAIELARFDLSIEPRLWMEL